MLAQIVRLAWQGAEEIRQTVYRNCLKLVGQTPTDARKSVAVEYLADAVKAVNGVWEG